MDNKPFEILMYHYVDNNISDPMCVSEDNFCKQLKYLIEEGYTFLSLNDVKEIIFSNKQYKKGVLITFDDGYKNTFDTVLPILNKYNARATVSICGSYIKEETCVKPTIHLSQEYGNVDDINRWIDAGNDVAAHSYSHKKLSHLSEEDIRAEVEIDNRVLKENINSDFECFFYPFGSVNNQVESIVAENYKYAFVTTEGYNPSYNARYRMGRIYVRPEWDISDFGKALAGDER
jgi:peptidoglycan/xylan/chitin deacetylase (PgdA/CDA1 family)